METNLSTTDKAVAPVTAPTETSDQQEARIKSWLYSITADQLMKTLVFYDNIMRVTPEVSFPETEMVLTKEGTLVLSWKDPLEITIGGGEMKAQLNLPQIEKPKFVTWPADDPFKWLVPAAETGAVALGLGLVTGYLLHH